MSLRLSFQSTLSSPVGKRGRPRKVRYCRSLEITDGITPQQETDLRRGLLKLPDVERLEEPERSSLIVDVIAAACSHQSAARVHRTQPTKKRGNRFHVEDQFLLRDCAQAWSKASGKNPALWEEDAKAGVQSVPVKIARIAIGIARGLNRPYTGSLKRQIASAHKIAQ